MNSEAAAPLISTEKHLVDSKKTKTRRLLLGAETGEVYIAGGKQ